MLRPLALLLAFQIALPAFAQQASDTISPEAPTGPATVEGLSPAGRTAQEAKEAGRPVEAQDWMVVAAHPLASEAGARVLREGGSAADAMVAVQAVLGLVEPQSSGLGGGAFLVWHDAETGTMTTLDARETAPMAATPRLFQTKAGEPLEFLDAVVGGHSVGTPGTPMLLEEAHRRWGQANWASLFDEAITLAEDGFAVSPRLAGLIAGEPEALARFPATAAYFLPEGQPVAEGERLKNPAYAATLRRLVADGADAFYTGPIAEDIVETVRSAEGNPGVLSLHDLAAYRVIERPPVCADYRGARVCGMGPPSSGALTVGMILGMLGPYDLKALGPWNPESWRLIGDATRLAFADRGRYIADSDFVPVPVKGLLDPAYLAKRAELLRGDDALPEVAAGKPAYDHAMLAPDESLELPSTSHISIVDAEGNALAMTTTIENGFGSRLMTNGFLLNNELTDFSFKTHAVGWPIANRVEPGKRPRSSMAPTIVLRDGKPVLVIGSPGGATIIGYVAQALIAHLDWGMDVQQAVAMPHLVNAFGTFQLEQGTSAEDLRQPLADLGYEVEPAELTSGLHAISLGDGLRGGADPRREGIALGE
ncbi:gamma-glutamyltransferase [Cereibacter sphaeroides]|uniref:gamma-glutamyltransferase n=1 Tax=Cereibacter sphaeroides TaxID=1063 RepID=UPI001F457113|nr:gamma-glutamyltransferase [Cereibacter sphaeroides]MCE6950295.1 gamma-glutamyltransferase [Cereibacter sphaeroides]